MAAFGTFVQNFFDPSRVIMTTPTAPPRAPAPQPMTSTPRAPTPPPIIISRRPPTPQEPISVPRFIPPIIVDPVPINPPQFQPSGGTTSGGGETSPPATGSGGGTGTTGGTGTSDTSRLFDLISAAFQPQEIGQTYGPQSVSDTNLGQSSGGTNPMAVVILAILVMAGIFLYANKKKKAA